MKNKKRKKKKANIIFPPSPKQEVELPRVGKLVLSLFTSLHPRKQQALVEEYKS